MEDTAEKLDASELLLIRCYLSLPRKVRFRIYATLILILIHPHGHGARRRRFRVEEMASRVAYSSP